MTELQKKLLPMLSFFHEYCKRNNLRYYVIGGTALGAERHKGFIPWDDDIDVGMPRPDYERLKRICKDENGYRFEFPGDTKDFCYPFAKLYDTNTTLVENKRYKVRRGIFLDIFPLDGLGNDMEGGGVKYFRKVRKKINLFLARSCGLRKGRKFYKNLSVLLLRCIPERILGRKKLMAEIDALSKRYAFDESKYVVNFVGAWGEKEIAKREFFGTPTERAFEDVAVMGGERIDEYLTTLYGDWRTPPPPEKQISHHDFVFLDLEKPYQKKSDGGGVVKRVITYGTFDLLHYGHVNILKRAKQLGDYLIVCLSTDEFNLEKKGKTCYFTYAQRKELLESIRYVDLVVPETCWEQKRKDVRDYQVDIFVMGDDWQGKFDYLKEEGAEVLYLPRTPEISTTQIKRDLKNHL